MNSEAQGDHHRVRPCRLHGGDLRCSGQPGAPHADRCSVRWPAHAHDARRELSRLRRRPHGPGADGELQEAGRALRDGDDARGRHAGGLLGGPFKVLGRHAPHEGHTVIIATGASSKLLGLEAEMQLMGRGVSTCATCDGFFFKDQKIMVVGGGDSALEEALYLSRLGSSVDLVHRRDTLRGSKIMQDRAFKNPKIQFLWDSTVEEILDPARGKVTGVKLRNVKTGALVERSVDGLFVAIGHQPNTQLFRGQIELLPNEYIKVKPGTTQTSVPGVFAAGDVHDHVYRQAVTAAGTGCMAALEAERYLEATQAH